ncbi:hypothetical protein IT575_15550 [bacterium]|nr:hypothetical protein [bacterium]
MNKVSLATNTVVVVLGGLLVTDFAGHSINTYTVQQVDPENCVKMTPGKPMNSYVNPSVESKVRLHVQKFAQDWLSAEEPLDDYAKQVTESLLAMAVSFKRGTPLPSLTPYHDGSIQLCWNYHNHYVILNVPNEASATGLAYVRPVSGKSTEKEINLTATALLDLLESIEA